MPPLIRPLAALVATLFAGVSGGAGAQSAPRGAPHPDVAVDSAIYIEHVATRDGEPMRWLEPADRLSHGDRVVTLVTWKKRSGHGGFTVTNALPRVLAYQSSAEGDEEVSADGGRSWGHLGTLTIGNRLATPEDVTHVRWRVPERLAEGGSGRIAYSGLVR